MGILKKKLDYKDGWLIKGELHSNYMFLFQLHWPIIGFYNPI